MKRTRFAAKAIGTALVAAVSCVGLAGVASAEPVPTPRFGVTGEEVFVFHDANPSCNGAVHVNVLSDPAVPGVNTFVFTPTALPGGTVDWADRSECAISMNVNWYDTVAPFNHDHVIPLQHGRGQTVADVTTGSGVNLVTVGTAGLRAKGTSWYVLTP